MRSYLFELFIRILYFSRAKIEPIWILQFVTLIDSIGSARSLGLLRTLWSRAYRETDYNTLPMLLIG